MSQTLKKYRPLTKGRKEPSRGQRSNTLKVKDKKAPKVGFAAIRETMTNWQYHQWIKSAEPGKPPNKARAAEFSKLKKPAKAAA